MFTQFLDQYLAQAGIPVNGGSKIGISPINIPQNEFQAVPIGGQNPVAPQAAMTPPTQNPEPIPSGQGGSGIPDIMGLVAGASKEMPGIMQNITNIGNNPTGAINALTGAIGQGFSAAGLGNPGDLLKQMGAPNMENLGASMQQNAQQGLAGPAQNAAPMPMNIPVPHANDPEGFPGFNQFKSNITGIESGGKYNAIGKITKDGDRAYGRYQVMGKNVRPWTKQFFGQELSPKEFLNNQEAQDKVFDGYTQRQYQKYGNWGDVATVWFAGPGGLGKNRSDGYTTTNQYRQRATAGIGQPQITPPVIQQQPMQNMPQGLNQIFGGQQGGLGGMIMGGLGSIFGL